MENMILEFDKRTITKEEMGQRAKYYAKKADEGIKLYSEGNKIEAMQILRELRKFLKAEYSYYSKDSVDKYIKENSLYKIYKQGLSDAYINQNYPKAYHHLHSNLCDIGDYISNYDMNIFFNEE